jgi:hypothetical protein
VQRWRSGMTSPAGGFGVMMVELPRPAEAGMRQPKIRQLLRLTGLDCRITLARTLDEALKARAATPTNPAYQESGPPSSWRQSNQLAGLPTIRCP